MVVDPVAGAVRSCRPARARRAKTATLSAISAIVTAFTPARADARDRALDGARRLPDALRLAGVLGAAQPDRRRGHALVADRTSALRAREPGLAVRMAVAVAGLRPRASVSACTSMSPSRPRRRPRPASASSSTSCARRRRSRRRSLSGYERVLCCAEIDEARALRAELGDEAVVGGERNAVVVDGFDVGASPREFARAAEGADADPDDDERHPRDPHGGRPVRDRAARLAAQPVGARARRRARDGGDVAIICSGFKGTFALDDAYCAGRIVAALGGEPNRRRDRRRGGRARVARSARGAERAHVRAARPRGRHRVLRTGGSAPDRAALLAHGRRRGGDRRVRVVGAAAVARDRAFRLAKAFRHTRIARGDVSRLDCPARRSDRRPRRRLAAAARGARRTGGRVDAGRVGRAGRARGCRVGGKASGTRRVL